MEDFYTLKDEECTLRDAFPKIQADMRTPEEAINYLTKAVALWKKIQSNPNLTAHMKHTFFLSMYEHMRCCHMTICPGCFYTPKCSTSFHMCISTHRDDAILHMENTSPDYILKPCSSTS